MNEFLHIYKKGGAQYESLAFDYLVGDLLIKDIRGEDKSRELTALNMEKNMPTDFTPAMFYTFLYLSNNSENINGKKFKDNVPLIYVFTSDANNVMGLNFNLIPNDVRAAILDIIVELTKNPMYDDTGNFKFNKTLSNLFILKDGITSFLKYVKQKTGLDVSNAVRIYSIKYIKKSRLIEYDMWKYIPFLNFKDAVRGVGLADLQSDIIKSNR